MDDDDFVVPLGAGYVAMTRKEALELRSLKHHPGYKIFRKLLTGINESAKTELQDPNATLDMMRVSQGSILAVAEVARVIEVDLETWYEDGKSNGDEETV